MGIFCHLQDLRISSPENCLQKMAYFRKIDLLLNCILLFTIKCFLIVTLKNNLNFEMDFCVFILDSTFLHCFSSHTASQRIWPEVNYWYVMKAMINTVCFLEINSVISHGYVSGQPSSLTTGMYQHDPTSSSLTYTIHKHN